MNNNIRYIDKDACTKTRKQKKIYKYIVSIIAIATMITSGVIANVFAHNNNSGNEIIRNIKYTPQQFKIKDVKLSKNIINEKQKLIVRGKIKNISIETLKVPEIQLSIRDKNKVNIYQWIVKPPKEKLRSLESTEFTAIVNDYKNITENKEKDIEIKIVKQ